MEKDSHGRIGFLPPEAASIPIHPSPPVAQLQEQVPGPQEKDRPSVKTNSRSFGTQLVKGRLTSVPNPPGLSSFIRRRTRMEARTAEVRLKARSRELDAAG